MTITKLLLLIMSTTFFVSFAGAADTPQWTAVAAAYSSAQTKGDSGAIEDALDLATKYVEQHPGDGRAMTYRGSLAAMKARESYLPWRKLGSLNQGVDWMDEGVGAIVASKASAGTGLEIEVRMVRGITSARIPKMFGRGSVARADFLAVIANPHFSAVNPNHKASAYAWLAVLSNRQNDDAGTKEWLSKARAADTAVANAIWEQYK